MSQTELHKIVGKLRFKNEPDWFNGKLNDDAMKKMKIKSTTREPVMQDDSFEPLFRDIGDYGLNYAYQKYIVQVSNPDDYKHTETDHPKNVIIIGAGMSGLASGYELAQVGHNVQILEMQHRVGGRVKTIGDEKFHKGQWADAGAMRLPGDGTASCTGPSHFMTDFYAQQFELPLKPFVNSEDEAFYSFYGEQRIKVKDFNSNSTEYCDQYWPQWSETINQSLAKDPKCLNNTNIPDISAYWEATRSPIIDELYTALEEDPTTAWQNWISRWAVISTEDFLQSTFDELILKLQNNGTFVSGDRVRLNSLRFLLPWPLDAIAGLGAINYSISYAYSLADSLRSTIGQYGSDPMHTFQNGLQMLPQAFVKENTKGWNTNVDLANNIKFGVVAREIRYDTDTSTVRVICHNSATKRIQVFEGDMVIITLPLHIIRQLTFTPPLPYNTYKAIENISYSPSTKIMLQCKTQFWQANDIKGGASRTNMPIGQLFYPGNPDLEIPQSERGVLMCYTWKQEALLFGSQPPEDAISEAVEEISKIHPEIYDNFEVGAVQAWYNDPSSQGAFCHAKPHEYLAQQLLYYPHENLLYFCGEAISSTNGWIHGALVSGLRSAFQLYVRNEQNNETTQK